MQLIQCAVDIPNPPRDDYPWFYIVVFPQAGVPQGIYNNDSFMQHVQQYIQSNVGDVIAPQNQPFNEKFTHTENTRVDGQVAYVFVGSMKEKRIVIPKGNFFYVIGGYGTDTSSSNYTKILSTFKFLDQTQLQDWETYTDPTNYYSFQYPLSWIVKHGLDFKTDTAIYDPTTTKQWPNVGGTIPWPAHYFDIISIEHTSKSAKQEADEYEKSWHVTEAQLHRASVTKDGIDFEFYDLEGESAVRYRNVTISNGNYLLEAQSSIDKLGDGSIESQILSTFKFNP